MIEEGYSQSDISEDESMSKVPINLTPEEKNFK